LAVQVPAAAGAYHRLILVVGPPRTGKTSALRELSREHGWPLLNVNLELSERLLELTSRQRALRAPRVVAEIVEQHPGEVLLLDNIEILFSPDLQQDPLRLLQGLSRNRTVVAGWSGETDGENLTYAQPPHPEYQGYLRPQVILVRAPDARASTDHSSGIPQSAQEKSA